MVVVVMNGGALDFVVESGPANSGVASSCPPNSSQSQENPVTSLGSAPTVDLSEDPWQIDEEDPIPNSSNNPFPPTQKFDYGGSLWQTSYEGTDPWEEQLKPSRYIYCQMSFKRVDVRFNHALWTS